MRWRVDFLALIALAAASIGTPAISMAVDQSTPLWRIPLQSLMETRDKPLFSPTRRPPPPPIVARPPAPVAMPVVAVEEPPLQASLVGVLFGPEGFSIAVLLEDGVTTPKRVHVGDSFKNWKLVDLRQREAVFQRGDQSTTLTLKTPSTIRRAVAASPMGRFPAGQGGPMPMPMLPVPSPQGVCCQ